ncbi:unnamed protein product [Peronospora belbahrii]|uniref:Uncharacterized protein n=1 Tax=Peronospora belbahrii TaxID=622444 RepID=A0AAU9KPY7_9STRA|nr:unnamed protein product [Peronospora belbahrii]
MQDQEKPPSFPNVPKSSLFSRLEAFLPVMAEENKKLNDAVAGGEAYKHSIEVEEDEEEQSDGHGDGAMIGESDKKTDSKALVIEMNFALGMMDENGSDGEDTNAISLDAQTKAPTNAHVIGATSGSSTQKNEDKSSFCMWLERPSSKPRPFIQELN